MVEMNEEYMTKVIRSYKKKQEADKARYDRFKDDEDFQKKNRERAKAHYDTKKVDRAQIYKDNKPLMNAKSSFYYYRRNNKLDQFQSKYPERVEILKENGISVF